MKNLIGFISLSFFLVLGACEKDKEVHTCPIVDVPYESVRGYGDTANMIRVIIYERTEIKDTEDNNFDGVEGSECIGTFLSTSSLVNTDSNINYYKITNELPDSIINNTNYGNTEWLVNVKYMGVGMECYVDAHLSDPMPGGVVYKNEVELVEVTHIEPFL